MNTIITSDGKYIGQYLHIQDTKFAIKIFTKFYNLAVQDVKFSIDTDITKDLILAGKYCDECNKVYVNDLYDENNSVLKTVEIGNYLIFIQETSKIYILDKNEFTKFMEDNNYKSDVSIAYVLGMDNDIKFDNMKVITANTLSMAKKIYMDRYNEEKEPICIGIMNNGKFNIFSDKYKITIPLVM